MEPGVTIVEALVPHHLKKTCTEWWHNFVKQGWSKNVEASLCDMNQTGNCSDPCVCMCVGEDGGNNGSEGRRGVRGRGSGCNVLPV